MPNHIAPVLRHRVVFGAGGVTVPVNHNHACLFAKAGDVAARSEAARTNFLIMGCVPFEEAKALLEAPASRLTAQSKRRRSIDARSSVKAIMAN
jgi:hypothetical protein